MLSDGPEQLIGTPFRVVRGILAIPRESRSYRAMGNFDYVYDEAALIDRLTSGLDTDQRPLSMLLGSAITAPASLGSPGIPGPQGVVKIIRNEFSEGQALTDFDSAIEGAENPYQAAFAFLLGRRGQQAANNVIKKAVWQARKPIVGSDQGGRYQPSSSTSDASCRLMDEDNEGWLLPPAAEAIGQLVSQYPEKFGGTVLTTNFDPLMQVAINRAGRPTFRTFLHSDGNISQSTGSGSHIVHLHGYWYGSDTLHTPRQLNQARPKLKTSLKHLLAGHLLLVSGYGGWDDVLTTALIEVLEDDNAYPEVIWTFRSPSSDVPQALTTRLMRGIDRGRVTLYSDIDCHTFFPKLRSQWLSKSAPAEIKYRTHALPSYATIKAAAEIEPPTTSNSVPQELYEADQDRPPLVDVYVGRETELKEIQSASFSTGFITGIGGQGKSALAARYFAWVKANGGFQYAIWRDCKEESERFSSQIIALIERLSDGEASSADTSLLKMDALAELLVKYGEEKPFLIVFDNIDHYIDLESGNLSGDPGQFTARFNKINTKSKVLFTCRPEVFGEDEKTFSKRISGLDLDAANELFRQRGASSSSSEIEEAHRLTQGHAFWLDLLAAQVAKRPNVTLSDLLDPLQQDSSEIPIKTLQSIWSTLRDREQIVLRALAETVRPTTEDQLASYLKSRMNFQKVVKALRYLRGLNLIVIKSHVEQNDVIELHPLVREFIRRNFSQSDRLWFIDVIIEAFSAFFAARKPEKNLKPNLDLLQSWTEGVELYTSAGKYDEAFALLYEIRDAFSSSEYPGEFVRVAGALFDSIDWKDHSEYKNFDPVAGTYIKILADLGRIEDSRKFLAKFRETVLAKNARYIRYCDLCCYIEWIIGDYRAAIEWGEEGKRLVEKSGVDTQYSTEHNLALARRDYGKIDEALTYFLGGQEIENVVDPEELADERGGAYYGNIGRCLHLMGQIDPALVCYRKSAILIERSLADQRVSNQGYIRQWIGELLLSRGEICAAAYFMMAALTKWEAVSPPKAEKIRRVVDGQTEAAKECKALTPIEAERYCVAWIYGRDKDFMVSRLLS